MRFAIYCMNALFLALNGYCYIEFGHHWYNLAAFLFIAAIWTYEILSDLAH